MGRRRLEISDVLFSCLFGGREQHYRASQDALPNDAKVINVRMVHPANVGCAMVELVLESEAWEGPDNGEVIPLLNMVITTLDPNPPRPVVATCYPSSELEIGVALQSTKEQIAAFKAEVAKLHPQTGRVVVDYGQWDITLSEHQHFDRDWLSVMVDGVEINPPPDKVAQTMEGRSAPEPKRELIKLEGGPRDQVVTGVKSGCPILVISDSGYGQYFYARTSDVTAEGRAIFRVQIADELKPETWRDREPLL